MVSSDLFYLSQMRMLGEFLETKGIISAKHITDLAEDLLHLSKSRKIYDQVRLLDENGMEIVRVNFNEGNPSIVADDKLQNKAKRYYFSETFVLDKGQIFVSPFDLNIEQGQIERPEMSATVSRDTVFDNIWIKAKQGEYVKPMIRFGTPVFDRQGQKRGIILLNYFGANLLRKINILSNSRNSKSMLLNSDGYWLKGQSLEDEWGFMYKNGKELTFGKVYPKAWQQIQSSQKGQFKTSQGLFTFSTVYPLLEGQILNSGSDDIFAASIVNLDTREYNWKVVSHIPTETLYSARNTLLVKICAVAGLLITLFAIGSLRLAWNITKRKQVEKKLENLAKFPSEDPNPVLRVAKNGVLLYANNASGSLLAEWNCQEGKIVPENWHQTVSKVFTTGLSKRLEIEHADRIFAFMVVPVVNAGYANFYGRDITERKKAAEALQISEANYHTIFDSANDAIFAHDIETGKILNVNQKSCEMFGYTKDELKTLSVEDISTAVSPHTQENALRWIKKAVKIGPQLFEWICKDKKGKNFWVEINLKAAVIEGQDCMLAIVRDITDRKQAENALEKTLDELETRVQERTKELATTVEVLQSEVAERKRLEKEVLEISEEEQRRIGRELHDGLQQELVGMTFECQLLHKKLTAKSLPEAGDAARIHRFLSDAIDHTRAITRMLYPIDLDSKDISFALRQLAARVKSLFHISCQFTCKKTLVVKRPDVAINIYRIVQEAVTNAIKHGKADSISINLKSSKNRITFTIRDNGTGLAADYEETEGMGLRIMKYRASMIGASLNIRSGTKSPGTLVTCSFESREDKL